MYSVAWSSNMYLMYIYIYTCKSLVGSRPQNQPQSARWITLSLSLCNSTLILPRMDDREDKVWWNTPRETKPGRNKATNQPTTNKTAEPTMRFAFPNLYFLVAKLLVKNSRGGRVPSSHDDIHGGNVFFVDFLTFYLQRALFLAVFFF